MDFRTFYLGLDTHEREQFAKRCGTTRGYCNQVAYADKRIELGLADVFVAVSGGRLSLEGLPLTDRAHAQRAIRSGIQTFPPPDNAAYPETTLEAGPNEGGSATGAGTGVAAPDLQVAHD